MKKIFVQTETASSQFKTVRAHCKFWTLSIFHYLNGRLPTTTDHLLVTNGKNSEGVEDEKLSLKQLYAKFRGTGSNRLASAPFLCVVALFLGTNDQVAKNLLTEVYKNLTLRNISSKDNPCFSEFSALTETFAEINARITNFSFENQEKSKSEKLEQEMLISEQYDFFGDETSSGGDGDLFLEGETELKDTKKDYEEPVLEIATEIEKTKQNR